MKKVLLLLMCVMLVLVICGCDGQDNNETPNNNINSQITYMNKNDLYFASGCDHALIEEYFKKNGVENHNKYTITASKTHGSIVIAYSITFSPKTNNFFVISSYTENGASYGIADQDTYKGSIEIEVNQSLEDAKYLGEYEHQAVALDKPVSAYYTAGFTFSGVKYKSLTKVADFDQIKYTGQIINASNYMAANKAFDKEETGAKCYECINRCLTALDGLFKKIDSSYVIANKYISESECNHIAVTDKGYDATCLETGMTDGTHCKICNKVLSKQQVIPAKGHTPIIDEGYPNTCTQDGLSEGSHCAVCNTVLTAQVPIPAKHNYINRECSLCHKIEPSNGLEFSSYYLANYGQCYGVTGIGLCNDELMVIPDTYNGVPVRIIGKDAFKGNSYIKKLMLNNNIVSIKTGAFSGCINLTEVNLPNTIAEVGAYSFYNCGYYNNSANWNNNVLYINSVLIEAKRELEGVYTIASGTTLISENAFMSCEKITTVTMPNSVLYVGNNAFMNCNELASVIMSNNVIDIGSHVFEYCKINKIYLPKSLRSYYSGDNIKTIEYAGTVSEWNKVQKGNYYMGGVTINCSNGTV